MNIISVLACSDRPASNLVGGKSSHTAIRSNTEQKLVQNCSGSQCRACGSLCSLDCKDRIPKCPRCAFKGSVGHCKQKMKRFNCPNPLGKKRPPPNSISDGAIGAADCPSLLALGRPGRFMIDDGQVNYAQSYDLEEGEEGQYDYDEYEPEFAAVGTPDELQDALRAGTNHIVITAHLDMTASTPEPDLNKLEALNSAIGRVSNTTLSIVVRIPVPAAAFSRCAAVAGGLKTVCGYGDGTVTSRRCCVLPCCHFHGCLAQAKICTAHSACETSTCTHSPWWHLALLHCPCDIIQLYPVPFQRHRLVIDARFASPGSFPSEEAVWIDGFSYQCPTDCSGKRVSARVTFDPDEFSAAHIYL